MKTKLNKMNDIEIIKTAINKKLSCDNYCDECHKALDRIYNALKAYTE